MFVKNICMKKIQPYLPFILMVLGSFRFGEAQPFREDGEFVVAVLMALGYYFSLKPTKYQKIINITTIIAAGFFCIKYFMDFIDQYRFHKDEAYAHLFICAGCAILLSYNSDYIKDQYAKFNKK
jgi:hypothetical protein